MALNNIRKILVSSKISPLVKRCSYITVKRPDISKLKMPVQTGTAKNAPSIDAVLREKIKLCGPMTVAEYMNIVVTNPAEGYYMHKDGIGAGGDFTTSPEISQLFGEMLAIWFYSETQKMGSPKPLQIVELGPGKGTLLVDIMRVISRLGYIGDDLSFHLVEISPTLQQVQANKLCMVHHSAPEDSPHYHEGETLGGYKMYWYRDLQQVPPNFAWYVAHEFFDALPVHKFQKTPDGWREILIDMDGNGKLGYKWSAGETKALSLFMRSPLTSRAAEYIEVSPLSLIISKQLSRRVDENGGIALIADYGHSGEKGDTFRAFKNHTLADPLVDPGTADLTADVDFSQLRLTAEECVVVGPTTQAQFLQSLHGDTRLKVLMENAKSDESRESLQSGYKMLTDLDKMGQRFKFMAFYPSSMREVLQQYPSTCFHEVEEKADGGK